MARTTMNHIIKHLRLKLNDVSPTPLTSTEYYKTDTIKLRNTYKDLDGNNTDPTSPTITIIDPNGTVTVSAETPTQEATGIYFYLYAPTAVDGYWKAEFGGSVDGEATLWPHDSLCFHPKRIHGQMMNCRYSWIFTEGASTERNST